MADYRGRWRVSRLARKGKTMRVLHGLLVLAAFAWSAWFLSVALDRWRFEAMCVMTCGPFWEAELIGQLRAEMDWQTPLLLALLPVGLLLGCWIASRLSTGRRRRA